MSPPALDMTFTLPVCYSEYMSTDTFAPAPATEAPAPRAYTIPAIHEAEFVKRVAQANTYLVRHGIDGAFTFSREAILVPSAKDADVLEEWITFTSTSAPTFALGDYVFVASLVGEEHGMVVHTAPGQSLVGWDRPEGDDQTCDHCALKRDRKSLYVVRNIATGDVTQVGSTCIQAFLGVEPKGLGMLEFLDALDAVVRGFSESTSTLPEVFTVDRILAVSAAITDMGRKYVSVARANEWERPSSASLIKGHVIYGAPRKANYRGPHAEADFARDLAEYQRIQARAAEVQADEALMADIKAAADTLNAGSDYADNMAIIVAGESVRTRNVGILASLLAIYARIQREAAEAKAPKPAAVTGFLAPVKTVSKSGKETATRLRNVALTLNRVHHLPEGDFGPRTILAGTIDGHQVEWFATGDIDAEAGDVLTLSAVSIKAHKAAGSDRYTKVDTTVLTRGVIA